MHMMALWILRRYVFFSFAAMSLETSLETSPVLISSDLMQRLELPEYQQKLAPSGDLGQQDSSTETPVSAQTPIIPPDSAKEDEESKMEVENPEQDSNDDGTTLSEKEDPPPTLGSKVLD
jgi:hypothetical protein